MPPESQKTIITRGLSLSPAQWIYLFAIILLCIYFAYHPKLNIFPSYSSYNEQRIQGILAMLIVVALPVFLPVIGKDWFRVWTSLPETTKFLLGSLAVLGLLSASVATYSAFALLEVGMFILMGMAAISTAASRSRLGSIFDQVVAISLLFAGWSYLALFFIVYFMSIYTDLPFDGRRIFHSFSFENIRFFSQFQSWTLSLLVLPLLLFPRRPIFLTFLFVVPAMGWWLLLFISGTRGTMLGFIVAFLAVVLIYRKQAMDWLRWQAVAITGGLLAYWMFFSLIPRLGLGMSFTGLTSIVDRELTKAPGRWELWRDAADLVRDNPLLGAGPMHFAASAHSIAAHPHNSILQIAAEWGLPAVLIVMVLFIWGMSSWLKDDNKTREADSYTLKLRVALFASLVTAAVHSLFSGIIVMPVSQIMMVLVIGWMLGVAINPADPQGDFSKLKRGLLLLIFVATSTVIFWQVLLHGPHLEESHRQYMDSHPTEQGRIYHPRFWLQGDISFYYQEPAMSTQQDKD